MQITNFDYARDQLGRGGSLARIATLIKSARAEAAEHGIHCLLFDNGDTLQGTPLADVLAREKSGERNPMVACMNMLQYDACGLGNHDFDHGLDYLSDCLSKHDMPIVCSNLISDALPQVKKNLMVDCILDPGDPNSKVRIGVLSSLPDKTALWSRHNVEARVHFKPPLPELKRTAAEMRANGADLVIVLAHMGLALFDEGEEAQNLVRDVAKLADVDVVIGGHTHLRFPGKDHRDLADVDWVNGTVFATPVVQPGASASDLGVIDLDLTRRDCGRGWKVKNNTVALRKASRDIPEDPDVIKLTAQSHDETRRFLSQPVAELKEPVNSFFALAHPCRMTALLAAAKRRLIESAIAGTSQADLPLVSVASAPLSGGFEGPDNFLDLSRGEIRRHHVAGMNPYANHVWAVKTTGAHLEDWLERSALIFNILRADRPDQMLIDPRVPGFRFDAIYGLTYEIDPRKPPRFDVAGRRVADQLGRVSNIRWQGEPLRRDQTFLVATTDHRASGGGLYKTFSEAEIVIQGNAPLQEAVLDYLQSADCAETHNAWPWSFAPNLGCSAILLTAPQAIEHLHEISHLRPEPCGETEEGFLRIRLYL